MTKLKKALGLRDLVLLNVATIIGLSSLTQAAQFGWSSLVLWIIAAVFFLIPSSFMVIDLNSRVPGIGGFYLWVKSAFGEWHGFLAAWCYWLSAIVWFPTVLFTISLSALYMFGDQWLHLKDNFWFASILSMALLWFTVILNVFGLKFGKWIQNIGAISLWVLFALLAIASFYQLLTNGSSQEISMERFIPDFGDFGVLPFFAAITFSFGGLELSSVMSTEMKDSKRIMTKAIFISALIVLALYTIGTFSLLIAIPEGQVGIIDGIAQNFYILTEQLDWPFLGPVGALLVTLGTLGLFAAWMNGNARLPFAIGIDNYLPPVLGKVHPKFGTPYISLIVQGVLVSILLLIAVSGTKIQEAYSLLYDMSVLLYFIPFIYMFSCFIWHSLKNTGGSSPLSFFEKKKMMVWVFGLMALSVILLSLVLAVMPSNVIGDKTSFYLKISCVTAVLIGIGLILFKLKKMYK
ncbi:APC family permease [Croceivirga thetidis]|uniref:Amino acid permease n=1 Tax=Croceivirga thetidis TaxID=2721623 RepID=A0ABX1GS28_9FLAO|nr:APC family permease [Croceivirga thetidis]NKI32743.1 amino acid permease [Croceivirga thetidis]